MNLVITNSEEETAKLAENFLKERTPKNQNKPILLFGDLGSGKTAFVKGLAKGLGIDDYQVKSPTYTFVREYIHGSGMLVHIDLYRLEAIDNLLLEQIEEYNDKKGTLVVIEWADRLGDNTPDDRSDICFEHIDENQRKITFFND
jgi:tRNA threonylcarbamoyladenosine biosynthesis protein TsaE